MPGRKKKLIIFDINGVLVKRWWKNSPEWYTGTKHNVGNHIVSLRPGVGQFMAEVAKIFEIGLWSSMEAKNMYPLVDLLQEELALQGTTIKYKFIFNQYHCVTTPDCPHPVRKGEFVLCKPFDSLVSAGIDFDPLHTCLVDDDPMKAFLNPAATSIHPIAYDGNLEDEELLKFLLPYLVKLAQHRGSVRDFILPHPYEWHIFEVVAEHTGRSQVQTLKDNMCNDSKLEELTEILDAIFEGSDAMSHGEFLARVQNLPIDARERLSKALNV